MRFAAFKMRPSYASRVTTFTLACVTDDLQWTKPWTVDAWHISLQILKNAATNLNALVNALQGTEFCTP